jgi:hypothetical protein
MTDVISAIADVLGVERFHRRFVFKSHEKASNDDPRMKEELLTVVVVVVVYSYPDPSPKLRHWIEVQVS